MNNLVSNFVTAKDDKKLFNLIPFPIIDRKRSPRDLIVVTRGRFL